MAFCINSFHSYQTFAVLLEILVSSWH